MKLALMQPYFFPYLGYFDLINRADIFVVFDEAQHIRRGWINRNRILHPVSGWRYVNVPLRKAPQEALIKDIEIRNQSPWKVSLLNQLEHYRSKAPYYEETIELVSDCLKLETKFVSELNVTILKKICDHLLIRYHFRVLSSLDIDFSEISSPTDWAIVISKALGADEYMNLPGGKTIYSPTAFEKNGLRLHFTNFPSLNYSCGEHECIAGLSVIDVLMWNGRKKTSELMKAQSRD